MLAQVIDSKPTAEFDEAWGKGFSTRSASSRCSTRHAEEVEGCPRKYPANRGSH